MFKLSPQVRKRLLKAAKALKSAEEINKVLTQIKTGNPLDITLAVAAVIGNFGSKLLADAHANTYFLEEGFKLLNSSVDEFIYELFTARSLPYRTIDFPQWSGTLLQWDCGVAVVLDSEDDMQYGPYVRPDTDIYQLVAEVFWKNSNELLVSATKAGKSWNQHTSFTTTQLPPIGDYTGCPSPGWIAERLLLRRKHEPNFTSSLMLIGPTGVGKTTLARLVGQHLEADAKVLQLSSSVCKQCTSGDIVELCKIANPTMLLLDDIQEQPRQFLLEILDHLVGKVRFLATTYMTVPDEAPDPNRKDPTGSMHVPYGLRPGRIDEYIYLPPPAFEDRRSILDLYLKTPATPELLTATEGLTGAYLKRIALNLNIFGYEDWEGEVARLRAAAPEAFAPEEDIEF